MSNIAANAGEWSEFYALIKLLCDEQIEIVDSQSNISGAELKRIVELKKDEITFQLTQNDFITINVNGSSIVISKSDIQLRDSVKKVFACIKNKSSTQECNEGTASSKKGAFVLPLAEKVAEQLRVSARKQNSSKKGDIVLKFSATDTGSLSKSHDASIKSWLGSNPTLFNASKHSTKLIFSVVPLDSSHQINIADLLHISNKNIRKPRDAVTKSFSNDTTYKLEFNRYASQNLYENLLEFDLNNFVVDVVVAHFSKTVAGASNATTLEQILKPKYPSFIHKWKTLLEICALGMTAASRYTPVSNISDNMIIIDRQGELCCLFGRNRLQDLLNEKAFIDSPDTGPKKHDYGFFYEDSGKIYIDLNFQIRLRKF